MPENTSLAVFDPHAAMVADLVEKNETQQFDITTEQGEKDLRSWIHRIKGGCGDIEKVRKSSKEGLLAMGKKIDNRAKELTAPLRAIQADRMKPLDEIEAKKRAEAEAIVAAEEKVKAEKAAAEQKELEEFRAKAQAQQEKEAAEKAAAEQVEREKQIAEDAKKQAIHDANELAKKVALDASEAAKKAEREKIEAIAKVKREAEEAIERERASKYRLAKVAEKIEAEAKAEEEARVADVEHRKMIEHEIIAVLSAVIDDDESSQDIVGAIVAGKIPNLKIVY